MSIQPRFARGRSRAARTAGHEAHPPAQVCPEALEPRVLLAFFIVNTTADAGPGSLRQAMLDANASPGADSIDFALPANSTIRPQSPLPPVAGPTFIRANPSATRGPTVEIDGSAAGPTADGLVFAAGAGGSDINALAVTGFGGSGVVTSARSTTTTGLLIKNSHIGVDLTGAVPRGNGWGVADAAGVKVLAGGDVVLGWPVVPGFEPAAGAVVAHNFGDGVRSVDGTVEFHGVTVADNARWGVNLRGGRLNMPGPDPQFRDPRPSTVSGNLGGGILLGPGSGGSRIRGASIHDNFFADGDGGGIVIDDSGGNAISYSSVFENAGGLTLRGPAAATNGVLATTITRNALWGVLIKDGAHDNRFGGARANPRDPSPVTDISSNGHAGDSRDAAPGVIISSANDNLFLNTRIDSNTDQGVAIGGTASGNLFMTFANIDTASISNNALQGVLISGDSARRNAFYGVSIHRNGLLPIDLYTPPVTPPGHNPNDPLDADVGANSLLNHPVIRSATSTADWRVTITGSIDTSPNTPVIIQLFRDTLPASGSFGPTGPQAEARVAVVNVTTDASGHAEFVTTVEPSPGGPFDPPVLLEGHYVTALATVPQAGAEPEYGVVPGDTSELSPGVRVAGPVPQVSQVYVAGSRWTQRFRNHLEYDSLSPSEPVLGSAEYGVALGPEYFAAQPRSLPWTNLDTVSVRFTHDVDIDRDDLRVHGERVDDYAVADFRYDPDTLTATWRLARAIPFDRVDVELDSGGDGIVSRSDGAALDGDEDGQAGGDFDRRVTVVPGDVVPNGRADALDLAAVRQSLNSFVEGNGAPRGYYFAVRDLDGSGRIDALDLTLVRRAIAAQPRTLAPASATAALLGTGPFAG